MIALPSRRHSTSDDGLIKQIAGRSFPPNTVLKSLAYLVPGRAHLFSNQMYLVFAMALLFVSFVLAGQYQAGAGRSPSFSVPILASSVRSSRCWRSASRAILRAVGIGCLIALSAKNTILIVEVTAATASSKGLLESTVEAHGALPADPDDVVCLHPRRAAAGAGDQRRRQCARGSISITVFCRHAGLDLPGGTCPCRRSSSSSRGFEESMAARSSKKAVHPAAAE